MYHALTDRADARGRTELSALANAISRHLGRRVPPARLWVEAFPGGDTRWVQVMTRVGQDWSLGDRIVVHVHPTTACRLFC